MNVVVLLGAPGAGKGTQAPLLAERLGIPVVATGDLFRAAVRDGTPLGIEARRYMDAGSSSPTRSRCDSSSSGSAARTRPRASSSTASRGRRSRPRPSTRRSPSAARGSPPPSSSTSRRTSSSGACRAAGSAGPPGTPTTRRSSPPRVAGRLRPRRLRAVPARGRPAGHDPGPDGPAARRPRRGHRALPERRRPVDRRRPAGRSTRWPRPSTWRSPQRGRPRRSIGARRPAEADHPQVAGRDREDALGRPDRRRGPRPRRGGASSRACRPPTSTASPSATSAPPAGCRRSRATSPRRDLRPAQPEAVPGLDLHLDRRRDRPRHPRRPGDPGRPDRVGRRRRDLRRLARRRRPHLLRAAARGDRRRGAEARRDDPPVAAWPASRRPCPGNHIGDISAAVEDIASAAGFGIVRSTSGHGIGTAMHEDAAGPQLPHGPATAASSSSPGICLAIEPMLTLGGHEDTDTLADDWTVVTADGSLAAHFEHTIAVTARRPGDPDHGLGTCPGGCGICRALIRSPFVCRPSRAGTHC